MIESKETKKKLVPNPRGNMPMSSSFGYVDLSFTNYRINTLEAAKADSVITADSTVVLPDTLK
jgi:hypothetical protein